MASDRFYFWRGYYEALEKLRDDGRRGAFVMAMCAYAFDGIEPDFSSDPMLDFAWSLITDQLSQSVEIGRRASRNGKKGGRPKGSRNKKSSVKSSVKSTAESDMNGHEMNGHEMNVRSSEDERGAGPPSRVAGRSAPVRPVTNQESAMDGSSGSVGQSVSDPTTNDQPTNDPITNDQPTNDQPTNDPTTKDPTTKDLIGQTLSPDYLIDLDEEDWDESSDLLRQEPIAMQDLSSLTGVTDDGAAADAE